MHMEFLYSIFKRKPCPENGNGSKRRCLHKRAAPAFLAAILPATVLAKSAGSNAILTEQLDAPVLTNGVDGAIAAVVFAAAVGAHAAAPAVFALNAAPAMLTNAAAAAVLAETLQSSVFANILPGAASAFHILVPAAAADVLMV